MRALLRILTPVVLAFIASGCVAASGNRGYEGGGRAGGGGGDGEEEADPTAAKSELRLAELTRTSGIAEAESALQFAKEDLDAARRALLVFEAVERSHAITQAQMGIDQAKNRLADAEAEMGELEAMYAADDFAEITKELVLSRGRRALDMAKRGLAVAETEFKLLAEQELPEKLRELQRAVREGELAVAETERALERAKLEGDTALETARKALAKVEKSVADAAKAKKED